MEEWFDAKMFWTQLEGSKVDLIFEQIQKVLLSLKKKIKDGTATNEESRVKSEVFPSTSCIKCSCSRNINLGQFLVALSAISFPFLLDHICSKKCLVKRPWDSYRGENPLNLPILCHFQRWNAKKDSASKSYDVMYRAPCGRTLRNFQEVQNYLFQTECNFLFLDHFSFNTYVQVFRKCPSQHVFEFDFDISQGAETVPVSFCNDIDNDQLPYLKYRKYLELLKCISNTLKEIS
uniref:MBD domain-containing protein n=1 Tax=Varanus komodoensis TaxID=61221 RepID=A0A8D2Q424_VARKO